MAGSCEMRQCEMRQCEMRQCEMRQYAMRHHARGQYAMRRCLSKGMFTWLLIGAMGLSIALAPSAGAQQASAPQTPAPPTSTISVTGRGEVQVAPDRARVQVGVETRANSSAAAAQENNRKQSAILDAIRKLGIPAAAIQTLDYSVQPIQRYDDKLRRVVIDGYQVSNVVQVETEKLELAGQIINAGLSNGANRVAGLDFLVKDRAKAQDAALALAVAAARRQADVAAKAAGGQVVELLELTIMDYEQPQPMPRVAMAMKVEADATPAPISAGTNTIVVNVSTKWRFGRP